MNILITYNDDSCIKSRKSKSGGHLQIVHWGAGSCRICDSSRRNAACDSIQRSCLCTQKTMSTAGYPERMPLSYRVLSRADNTADPEGPIWEHSCHDGCIGRHGAGACRCSRSGRARRGHPCHGCSKPVHSSIVKTLWGIALCTGQLVCSREISLKLERELRGWGRALNCLNDKTVAPMDRLRRPG